MEVIYALQPIENSIFLAGPTPRAADVLSWRPEALDILDKLGFDGKVFVPEASNWKPHKEYYQQIAWEWEALNQATIVVFWVPRTLDTMPAFTTNVEFGFLVASGKVVLGAPPGAKKMGYMRELAKRFNLPMFTTLQETLAEAVSRTQKTFGHFK